MLKCVKKWERINVTICGRIGNLKKTYLGTLLQPIGIQTLALMFEHADVWIIEHWLPVQTSAFKHPQPIFEWALLMNWYVYTLPKKVLCYLNFSYFIWLEENHFFQIGRFRKSSWKELVNMKIYLFVYYITMYRQNVWYKTF